VNQRQHQLRHFHHVSRLHPRCDSFVAIARLVPWLVDLLDDGVDLRLNLRADLLGPLFDLCEDSLARENQTRQTFSRTKE
jgi:hypothetical protein